MGDFGGYAGWVVGRRHFDDVEGDDGDAERYLADRAEELAGGEAAWFGRAGAGSEGWIQDIDVNGDVDDIGAIQRLFDGFREDGIEASLFDFAHEVAAHAMFGHPGKDIGRGPIATQADLDEVASGDVSAFDEAAHRSAMAERDAKA